MVGVAQDAQGAGRVRPIVLAAQTTFPVLIDRASTVAAFFGFQITPSGIFLDAAANVTYVHGSAVNQFDVDDPRVRLNLDVHLAGGAPQAIDDDVRASSQALEIFGEGAVFFAAGDTAKALDTWHRALAVDPDNFLIRSQIWAVENPERFWPAVDRKWQEAQLLREGYDQPLP
jgi:hypothetical protein